MGHEIAHSRRGHSRYRHHWRGCSHRLAMPASCRMRNWPERAIEIAGFGDCLSFSTELIWLCVGFRGWRNRRAPSTTLWGGPGGAQMTIANLGPRLLARTRGTRPFLACDFYGHVLDIEQGRRCSRTFWLTLPPAV
jgi:hypothetical protein